MADLHKAFAPLGTLGRWLLAFVVIEAAWLLAEIVLARAVGQQAIAAAMITAPRSRAALLGAAAVVVRIIAHALFPALFTFLLTFTLIRRAAWSLPLLSRGGPRGAPLDHETSSSAGGGCRDDHGGHFRGLRR